MIIQNAIQILENYPEITYLVGETKSQVDFKKVSDDAQANYPYLSFGNLDNDYYATEEEAIKVARYINSTDLFEKLQHRDLLSEVIDSDCNVDISDEMLKVAA